MRARVEPGAPRYGARVSISRRFEEIAAGREAAAA
jgi:hypothetical protein